MKKHKELELVFYDAGTFVKAALGDGEKLLLDYENEEAKPVRVRAPLPKKQKIIDNAKYWVEKDDRWESVEQWIDFYIHCREKEVYKQVQEIRKSIKRLKQYSLSISIAKEALSKYGEK